jgi:tetratricopeptide (TPR) repeat protein
MPSTGIRLQWTVAICAILLFPLEIGNMNHRYCLKLACTLLCLASLGWVSFGPAWSQVTHYQMDDNAITHFRRGQMWMSVNQYEAAIRSYQIAIRLKPSSIMTAALYNDLGLAYMKIHDYPKAIVSFQQALTHNPSFSLYYEHLVKAYQTAGSLETAQKQLEQSTTFNPEDTHAWFLLGLVHWQTGNQEASRQAFETYLRLAPQTELADAAKLYVDRFQSSQTRLK